MKTNNKLNLNKTTVAHLECILDFGALDMVKGGTGVTDPNTRLTNTNSPMFC